MSDSGVDSSITAGRDRFWFLLLILFSFVLLFYNLGENSLHNGDEAKFAFISKGMLRSGDWMTPRIEGEPYFGKPPLRFWLTALLFQFFGTSEWVIRFWSAAAALGCIVFTVLLGKRLFGNMRSGLWAGFALATSVQFVYEHCAKTGEMDALLLFFLVSSLYFFVMSEERPHFLFLSAGLMGMASLTKNIAGVLPLGVAVFYSLTSGSWRKYPSSRLLLAFLLFLGISGAWMAAMTFIHQSAFVKEFLIGQTFRRAVSSEFGVGLNEARTLTGGLYFVGSTILNGFYPWSLVLPLSMAWTVTQIRKWRHLPAILPVVWFVVVFIAVLLFRNKLYWYLLPIYPAACLLVGKFVSEALSEKEAGWKCMCMVLVFGMGAAIWIPNTSYNPFAYRAVESAVGALILNPYVRWSLPVTVGFLIFLILTMRASARLFQVLLIFMLFTSAVFYVSLPLKYSDFKSEVHQLALAVSAHAKAGRNSLYLWRIPKDVFYPSYPLWKPGNIARWYFRNIPGTHMYFLNRKERLVCERLREGGNKLFLMQKKDYDQIKHECPHSILAAQSVHGALYILIGPSKVSAH